MIFVTVNDKKIVFKDGDFEKDILLADVFFGAEVVIDEIFNNGDDEYYIYLRFSPDDFIIDSLVKKNDVGVNYTVLIDDFYRSFSKFSNYFISFDDKFDDLYLRFDGVNGKIDGVNDNINGVISRVDEHYLALFDNAQDIKNILSEDYSSIKSDTSAIYGMLSDGVVPKLSSVSEVLDGIDGKFDNINVDLSPVTEKLDVIDEKFDILKVINVSEIIDEKISQLFSMKSLNGSNGSKFKDGASVTVKGYDGEWIVEGSYPMLNADNVTIIVYKLKQNDMVLLAPAPFVEKV